MARPRAAPPTGRESPSAPPDPARAEAGAAAAPAGGLAGPAILALALAWLPGQAHAGAVRWWVLAGVLPLVVASLRPSVSGAARGLAALPFVALAAWSALGALWVPAPGGALRVALTQAGWAAMALAGAATPSGLPAWVAAAGVVAALPALAADGGTFGNGTLLAGFLGPALVMTWAGAVEAHGRPRAALLAAAAVQGAALAGAGSLAGLAAPVVGLAAWVALPAPGHPVSARALIGGAAVAALALALPELAPHLEGRLQMARIALGVAADAFPLGVGAGQLTGPFLEEQARQVAAGADPALWTLADHAHSEPIHALAELGLPGLLLLVPLGAALARAARTPARLALWAAVPAMLTSLPLYEPASAGLIAACAGACLAEGRRGSPLPRTAHSHTAPGVSRGALVGVTLAGALLASAHLVADRLLVRGAEGGSPSVLAAAAALSLTPEPALRTAADRLLPEHPTRARLLADEAAARQTTPAALLLAGRASLAALEPLRAADRYEAAARLHPRLFAAWLGLAVARGAAGDHAGASAATARAARLRPSDPRLRWLR